MHRWCGWILLKLHVGASRHQSNYQQINHSLGDGDDAEYHHWTSAADCLSLIRVRTTGHAPDTGGRTEAGSRHRCLEDLRGRHIFILAVAYLVLAEAANIPILKTEQKVVGIEKDKNYRYLYQTGNGIFQEEQGIIKHAGQRGYETQLQEGQFQYVSPEGRLIQLRYTADENGFRPVGDHIPTPPPVPIEIQKLLAVLATKKPDPADSNYDDAEASYPDELPL